MELFSSQDPRSYSLFFDLNIWFRARKVTGTFEKRAPGFNDACPIFEIKLKWQEKFSLFILAFPLDEEIAPINHNV